MKTLLCVLFLICAASAVKIYPHFDHRIPHGRTTVFRDVVADQTLPCQTEGYFVNPRNCSQFYRCVDYLGTNQVFSRYIFECPKDHVFITVKDTCVPGTCAEISGTTVPVQVVQLNPNVPVTSAPSSFPTDGHIVATNPPTSAPVEVTTFPPQTPSPQIVITAPTDAPTPPSTATPAPVVTNVVSFPESCEDGLYAQHARFCNIYHPCLNDKVNYACDVGLAFDYGRQMCRYDQDGQLCAGKEVMEIKTLYSGLTNQISNAQDPAYPYNQVSIAQVPSNINTQNFRAQVPSHINTQNFRAQVPSHINTQNFRAQVTSHINTQNFRAQVPSHIDTQNFKAQVPSHIDNQNFKAQVPLHINTQNFRAQEPTHIDNQNFNAQLPSHLKTQNFGAQILNQISAGHVPANTYGLQPQASFVPQLSPLFLQNPVDLYNHPRYTNVKRTSVFKK